MVSDLLVVFPVEDFPPQGLPVSPVLRPPMRVIRLTIVGQIGMVLVDGLLLITPV